MPSKTYGINSSSTWSLKSNLATNKSWSKVSKKSGQKKLRWKNEENRWLVLLKSANWICWLKNGMEVLNGINILSIKLVSLHWLLWIVSSTVCAYYKVYQYMNVECKKGFMMLFHIHGFHENSLFWILLPQKFAISNFPISNFRRISQFFCAERERTCSDHSNKICENKKRISTNFVCITFAQYCI